MPGTPRWRVFPDAAALAEQAAARILDAARAAISARGIFHLVLAGGRTPLAAYAHLAHAPGDWVRWHIWFGDERCLPQGDPGRNDSAIRAAWLDHIPLPAENLHPVPAELGSAQGALRYAGALAAIGEFDLVLLGLGEDGHTASLFTGQPGAPGDPDAVAVHGAPKLPAERISLSATRLSRARAVLFLVSGADKQAAVAAWCRGADLPAAHIAPPGGVEVWLDRAAAGDQAWPAPGS
jgi:6-phosphogluconolactonase